MLDTRLEHKHYLLEFDNTFDFLSRLSNKILMIIAADDKTDSFYMYYIKKTSP